MIKGPIKNKLFIILLIWKIERGRADFIFIFSKVESLQIGHFNDNNSIGAKWALVCGLDPHPRSGTSDHREVALEAITGNAVILDMFPSEFSESEEEFFIFYFNNIHCLGISPW
jgi:hypothetical protein